MPCQRISCIHAAVLSAGATKIYCKVSETTFDVCFNCYINNVKYTVEEILHPRLSFKVFHYRPVTSMYFLVNFMSSGIVNAAAVKYKSTTIARLILRNSISVREAAD